MTGPIAAAAFAVLVVVLAAMSAGSADCPRGSVTASGIARCR